MCSTTATVTRFCPADIQKLNKLDQLQDMAREIKDMNMEPLKNEQMS